MPKIFEGHLVDQGTWEYYWNYEDWDLYVREKYEGRYNVYFEIPTRKEIDELCKI